MSSVDGPESLADQPILPAARHHELLLRVLHGTFWILKSNVFGKTLDLARGVILAMLLEPDDFGLSHFRRWVYWLHGDAQGRGRTLSGGIVGVSAPHEPK